MRERRFWRIITISALAGCVPASALDGPQGKLSESETSPLGPIFTDAAERWEIPVDLLKAVAFIETGFTRRAGQTEFDGQPEAWGYFGLRGEELERAASLAQLPLEMVKSNDAAQIEAAAALLDACASNAGLSGARGAHVSWSAALAHFSDVDVDLRQAYARDVLAIVDRGKVITLDDGTTLVIARHATAPYRSATDEVRSVSAEITGAANTIYLPSPNWSYRPSGTAIEMVVIHTCEGNYGGCVGWLRNTRAEASAHYVVKEDGSEIAQLVDESLRAWHVAATYRPWLNDGALGHLSGRGVNNFSIGIEHGGSASQGSFPAGQISASVNLVRDITARHGIPRDRYHIVSHGRLQPENRSDPGPNWPWGDYLARISNGGGSDPVQPEEPSGGKYFSTGDFDGNGTTDWAWFAWWTNDFIVMLSNGDGTFREVHNGTGHWGDWSKEAAHFSTGDYDGDGTTDWSWYAYWTNDFIVLLSNGDGTFREVHNDTTRFGNWAGAKFFTAADYDGDGATDWAWLAPWTSDFLVMLSNRDGTFRDVHNGVGQWGGGWWDQGRHYSSGDFDGDGRADWSWYAWWTNDFIVLLSNGDGTFREVHNDTTRFGNWADARHFKTGDFNGDGATDWSWFAPWTSDFIVMLSNRDGRFSDVHNGTGGWGDWSGAASHFATGDYNGDGRTDWSWYASWTNDFIVMLSDGAGHFGDVHNDTTGWGDWSTGKYFRVGDYDRNGTSDWSWYAPWTDDFIVMLSSGDGTFGQVHNGTGGWGKF